jgi:hypothetical protein
MTAERFPPGGQKRKLLFAEKAHYAFYANWSLQNGTPLS